MYKFLLLFFFTVTTLFAGEIYIQLPLTKSTKNLYAIQKRLSSLGLTMRINKYPQGYSPFVGPIESKSDAEVTLLKIRTYVSKRAKMYTTAPKSDFQIDKPALFLGGVMSLVSVDKTGSEASTFLDKNSPDFQGLNIGLSFSLSENSSASLEYEYLTSEIATAHNILTCFDYTLYKHQYFNFDVGALLGIGFLNFDKLPVSNVTGDFKSISPLYGADMKIEVYATKEISFLINYRPIFMQHELSIKTLTDNTVLIQEKLSHQFLLRAKYSF